MCVFIIVVRAGGAVRNHAKNEYGLGFVGFGEKRLPVTAVGSSVAHARCSESIVFLADGYKTNVLSILFRCNINFCL
jgi:hypothetical protein